LVQTCVERVSNARRKVGEKSRDAERKTHLPGLGQRLGVIEVAECHKGLVALQFHTKSKVKGEKNEVEGGGKKVRQGSLRQNAALL
jgi:hypothetical protein